VDLAITSLFRPLKNIDDDDDDTDDEGRLAKKDRQNKMVCHTYA